VWIVPTKSAFRSATGLLVRCEGRLAYLTAPAIAIRTNAKAFPNISLGPDGSFGGPKVPPELSAPLLESLKRDPHPANLRDVNPGIEFARGVGRALRKRQRRLRDVLAADAPQEVLCAHPFAQFIQRPGGLAASLHAHGAAGLPHWQLANAIVGCAEQTQPDPPHRQTGCSISIRALPFGENGRVPE
jgi:hypothetical protein